MEFLSTNYGIAAAFGAAGLAAWIGMLLKSRAEERHKVYIDVAQKLSSIGFQHIPKILICLATHDLTGAIRESKVLYDILHDKTKRIAELKDVAKNLFTDLYQDPNYRQEIDDFIQALRDKHLPDKASAFSAAVDEASDQKNIFEDIKAKLAAAQAKFAAVLPQPPIVVQAAPAPVVVQAAAPAAPEVAK